MFLGLNVVYVLPFSCCEVVCHPAVEGEHGGGSSDLSSHVTDGSHTYTLHNTRINSTYLFRQCVDERLYNIQSISTLPVQEMESTPSPKYSTMAPVPPFTVRIPAT